MSFRAWLSVITLVLIGAIIYFSRHELVQAWDALGGVNLWVLALLVPMQVLAYYAAGEMTFSYLKDKGFISGVSRANKARMSLELNFVNHVLPSGGVSGISYMTWRLGLYGVIAGRATMAQVVRYAMGLASFLALLLVAVLLVTIDGSINRWIILVSSGLISVMLFGVAAGIFLMNSIDRLNKFSVWATKVVNRTIKSLSFGRSKKTLEVSKVATFLNDLHYDFLGLKRDRKVLKKPFLWGIVFNIADVSLFLITFWALGYSINPAPVFIAYGVASLAGFIVFTPGGAGAYEAIMVAFLVAAGVASGSAIIGILLTRVIVLIGTIILGYVFYQHAILKYGKGKSPIKR